jgi:hypothetical protein
MKILGYYLKIGFDLFSVHPLQVMMYANLVISQTAL